MNTRYLIALYFIVSIYIPVAAEEVKIGSVVGITGPTATASAEALAMSRGYVAMVNDQGGINGNPLRLITRDDQYDAKKTVGLVEEVITQENVLALVNGAGTAQTSAIMKSGILQKHKVPLVGVFSGAEFLWGPGSEQIFHTRVTYKDEIFKIASLISTLGYKRVAVVYQGDVAGSGIIENIETAARKFDFGITTKVPYRAGNVDFSIEAKKISDAHPQAIFLMGVPNAVAQFMKVYNAPVGSAQIFTLSYVSSKELADFAGETRVRGVGISQVVPNPNSSALILAKDFQKFIKSPFGRDVQSNSLVFEAYINLRILTEAIRMAGNNPTSEKITIALKSMSSLNLGGLPIKFSETSRSGSSFLDIGVIGINGRLSY